MKQFIRLHNTDTNTVIIVSIDDINIVDTSDYGARYVSRIYCKFSPNGFLVNETPEKIYSVLNENFNTNIIRLHNSDNNTVILTTIDNILLVDSEMQGKRTISRVYTEALPSGFTVNETVDKIYAMISNKKNKNNKTA